MTNPNNAIGTNAAFNGRTSPNALNDILASFSKGIVSGWACSPKSGMTVQLGGASGTRDVAIAEDNGNNKLTINNRSGSPVEVTLGGAPSTNNRIDVIVAYIDNPSIGDNNTTDNPTACGIIAVQGTVAANPTAPTDAQIRNAITTDGATGGVAYYVVLATILVGTNVTTIGSGAITQGAHAIAKRAYRFASTMTRTTVPTTMTNRLSVTIQETGAYRVEGSVRFHFDNSAQDAYGRIRLVVNGSVPSGLDSWEEITVLGTVQPYASEIATVATVLNLKKGDVLALQAQSAQTVNNFQMRYSQLFAERIA